MDRKRDTVSPCIKSLTLLLVCILYPYAAKAAEYVADANLSGEKYFNEHAYEKALPLLEEEANKGIKPSIYRLAYMYQNGLGVGVNYKKAAFWFQQAASEYSYTLTVETEAKKEKKSFFESLHDQINPATNKEGTANLLRHIDTNTSETAHLVDSILYGDFFGLRPYETNFILPIGYSTHKYPHPSSTNPPNTNAVQPDQYSNTESEFQISLTKMLTYNLFGWNENINFAYTQKVWWQSYSNSAPFRETMYSPEIFIEFPVSGAMNDIYGLKVAQLGFLHESNGQDGYRSRSWNRLYLRGMWQWENLFISTRVWYKIPEKKKYDGYYEGAVNPVSGTYEPNYPGDDNPNIQDYLGYGDINIKYLYEKHEIGILFRNNLSMGGKNRGAIDVHWSYPFLNSENTFWYVKFFNGYGESLIDYDRSLTKALFGFSFSREWF
jgi:phospholipase A1